jgi:hypothetical protein
MMAAPTAATRIIRVPLSRITGEHKVVAKLRRERKVFFSQQAACLFTEEGLQLVAKYHPIWVTPDDEDFRCFGNLRYFHLFETGLPKTAEIPVMVFDRVSKKDIEELFHLELLLVPEVFVLTGNDRRHMSWQWQQEGNASFLATTIRRPELRTLAEMLGCEVRTLKGGKLDAIDRTEEEPGAGKAA